MYTHFWLSESTWVTKAPGLVEGQAIVLILSKLIGSSQLLFTLLARPFLWEMV